MFSWLLDRMLVSLVIYLVGWLVRLLVGRLGLVGVYLVGWLACWLIGWLVGW